MNLTPSKRAALEPWIPSQEKRRKITNSFIDHSIIENVFKNLDILRCITRFLSSRNIYHLKELSHCFNENITTYLNSKLWPQDILPLYRFPGGNVKKLPSDFKTTALTKVKTEGQYKKYEQPRCLYTTIGNATIRRYSQIDYFDLEKERKYTLKTPFIDVKYCSGSLLALTTQGLFGDNVLKIWKRAEAEHTLIRKVQSPTQNHFPVLDKVRKTHMDEPGYLIFEENHELLLWDESGNEKYKIIFF